MKWVWFFFGGIFFVCASFVYINETDWLLPKEFPKPEYDFAKNPISASKIELGRALFYDPILSIDNTISCASCHSQYSAFTHVDHNLSHGIQDRIGFRNSPALMNLAWQKSFMRDGAVNHLDMQALAPISNPDEMGEDIQHVVEKLRLSQIYAPLFENAFGDKAITGERVLKALSQFMLTLVSNNAKYDSVMRKEAVFTEKENKGYAVFEKHCNTCHTEPLFTNDAFINNGLAVDPELNDYGRFRVTQNAQDSFKFRVPTLRNIEFSYPYMHDGRFKKLNQVINHYTSPKTNSTTLDSRLANPMQLTSEERVELKAFLLTLTDKHFLFDTHFSYPKHIFGAK